MNSVISESGVAITVFASTNIDDILILSALFSDNRIEPKNIVFGQYLGIAVLVLGSAIAAMASTIIPHTYISLLGLIPLGLGIVGAASLLKRSDHYKEPDLLDQEYRVEKRYHSQILAVSGITIANGGDNIGVYIPMFANDISIIPLYTLVFTIATAVWCLTGYYFVNNAWLGFYIRRYGKVALPFILMAIGVHILCGYFT